MVRHSTLTFFFVSIVAIVSLSMFFDAAYTGSAVSLKDCSRYAYEYDLIFSDTVFKAQGKEGYFRDAGATLFNPCTGVEEGSIFEAFVQAPPLLGYGRFVLSSGTIFAFQGAPEPGKGNILYWICPPDETGFQRARIIIYDKEICNSFEDTFIFTDDISPRGTL